MAGRKRKDDQEKNTEEKEEQAVETEAVKEDEPGEKEELTELEKAAREWEQEKEELLDKIKRKQADIDNLRRISKMEQAEAREYALHQFLCRLLPVLDNLERALESALSAGDVPDSYVEGLKMIHRQLLQILEQEGVSEIEAAGCPFDPTCHHAVMQEDREGSEPGTVLEELQKGYRHRSRILRPSMVKVCKD